MHSRASEEEKIVDIYFSDKETVLPYQTVTLTSQKEPAGGKEAISLRSRKQQIRGDLF